MASSRKRCSVSEALLLLENLSDDEDFDGPSSDNDWDERMNDVNSEPDSDEDEHAPVTFDKATTQRPPDNDCDDEPLIQLTTAWVRVLDSYELPTNIPFTASPGIKVAITAETTPIELLQLFITDEIVMIMVNETNKYAQQFVANTSLKPKSRVHQWEPTTSNEMHKFLGILFLMGVVTKPTIEDYWCTDPLISTPMLTTIMRHMYVCM